MTNDQDGPQEKRKHSNRTYDTICKMPIGVAFKKSGKNGYKSSDDLKGHAYLGFDRNGSINFYIIVKSLFGIYHIRISQWNLFRMLLYRITLRPIQRKKNSFYMGKKLRRIEYDDAMFDYPIERIKEEIELALKNINIQIKISDGDDKILAEKQLDKLLSMQGKSELWNQINVCKNYKRKVEEVDIFDSE